MINGPGLAARWARPAFWCYAIVLFVGTHLPGADLGDGPIPHPDKVVHVVVFGVWALLFAMTGYAGARDRAMTWAVVWGVGSVYAAVDEGLQAIPAIRRHFSLADLGANLAGVLVVSAWGGVAARPRRAGRRGCG